MRCFKLSNELLQKYEKELVEEEKSNATISKYMYDIQCFKHFINERAVQKSLVLDYKNVLKGKYALTSVNSKLAALNSFLRFSGYGDFCVKQIKIQKSTFNSESKVLTKSEYFMLVEYADNINNQRLSLILQTVCATGIRISELEYITVEGAQKGEITVTCKGKTRKVFIVGALSSKLLKYAEKRGIEGGRIFVTRSGNPINRSNVWQEMKVLCKKTGINPEKVYPHNLRHLFARTFYEQEKDIAKLADILGHSNVNTTRIYIATTSEEHRKKVENLNLIT